LLNKAFKNQSVPHWIGNRSRTASTAISDEAKYLYSVFGRCR